MDENQWSSWISREIFVFCDWVGKIYAETNRENCTSGSKPVIILFTLFANELAIEQNKPNVAKFVYSHAHVHSMQL